MKAALVVLGATGIVGRGVVQAAVAAKRPVIAVARDPAGLDQLRLAHADADIVALAGSVGDDEDSATLAEALRGIGRPIAGVVAAVAGTGGRGRLLDQPTQALRCKLEADLLPHLAAARALLPLLAAAGRGGSYVLIGGPGSELPWAGYGLRSVVAASLRMLACVLHDEAQAMGVRVQLLAVDAPVRIDAQRADTCPQWPTATAIGHRALSLVDRASTDVPTQAIVPYAAVAGSAAEALTLPPLQPPASKPAPMRGDSIAASARCQRDAHSDAHSLVQALLQKNTQSPNANEVHRHDIP